MTNDTPFAICMPLANEEQDFDRFMPPLRKVLRAYPKALVYLVVDQASHDRTSELCMELAKEDTHFRYVWAPENKNVVDAYLRGFREAMKEKPEFIVEMDGGGSHDPRVLPAFVRAMTEGNECAFGSRYINGGSMVGSPFRRRFLSKFGSLLARVLLGCPMRDVTSGYEAFSYELMEKLLAYPLRSKAHFYQTELRYLCRHRNWIEIPIHYTAPSPRVSPKALKNARNCLIYYTLRHWFGKAPAF
ncbi:MAG: glycosyltransferase [Akkermansia sp.]